VDCAAKTIHPLIASVFGSPRLSQTNQGRLHLNCPANKFRQTPGEHTYYPPTSILQASWT
jgi:hypothetical protein